jgi:hypothetical protein
VLVSSIYTFNNVVKPYNFDLNHRDKLLQGEIKIIDNKTNSSCRSEAWARDQYVYAQLEFNVPMKISKVEANQENKLNSILERN